MDWAETIAYKTDLPLLRPHAHEIVHLFFSDCNISALFLISCSGCSIRFLDCVATRTQSHLIRCSVKELCSTTAETSSEARLVSASMPVFCISVSCESRNIRVVAFVHAVYAVVAASYMLYDQEIYSTLHVNKLFGFNNRWLYLFLDYFHSSETYLDQQSRLALCNHNRLLSLGHDGLTDLPERKRSRFPHTRCTLLLRLCLLLQTLHAVLWRTFSTLGIIKSLP